MKYIYKLTDKNMQTKDGFQYKKRRYVSIKGNSNNEASFCSPYWLHAYQDPLLAAFMASPHCVSFYTRLFESRWKGEIAIAADKIGVTSLALWKEIKIPTVTKEQRVTFEILSAKQIPYLSDEWYIWADNWLSGEDRTAQSARAVKIIPIATSASAAAHAATELVAYLACNDYFALTSAAIFAIIATDVDLVKIAHEAISY